MKRTVFFLFFLCLSAICFGQNQLWRNASLPLKRLLQQKRNYDSLELMVSLRDLSILKEKKIIVLSLYQPAGVALVKLTLAQLQELMSENELIFADARRTPKEELTTGSLDITLNKINFSHHQHPSINGDSVVVSLKEQQFDTTDIDIKGRYVNSNVASSTQSTHAAIMATIVAGAGNSSPYAKGVAWGSSLTSSDYTSLLPDADSIYRKFTVSVQNHSYGTAIENYYGGDAAAYDQSSNDIPTLLHVFSAGNSGNKSSTEGTYAGLNGYANLTGSFKMSKNSIAVGATDSFNHVSLLSSKGPAYDGRVKPELVAFGEDGSSGAAALVSGTVALVQQAYRQSGSKSLPSNALVKAILLNSADDVERVNVDYASGYGALNAANAVKTILERRYHEDSAAQGEIKTIPITIPAKTALAKFTISWTDAAATPNAVKALVNDIDAELYRASNGETWQPWVLSAVNNLDSILRPARRSRDTINTNEQITIDNPVPGDYLLRISGSNITSSARQAFAVAYQFDSATAFAWTYPTTTDPLPAKTTQVIRWQTNIRDTASIDYSLNGHDWQTIATGVNLKDQYYEWQTPDTNSLAYLRMRVTNQNVVFTTGGFAVSNQLNMQVGFNCVDSFLLFWHKLPVTNYQLYSLGQKYLEPLLVTGDTLAVLNKQQFPSLYYSIAPVIGNKAGFRSYTANYETQGVGCYVSSFLATLENTKAALQVELGTVYGIQSIQIIRTNAAGKVVVQTINSPSSINYAVTDPNLTSGINAYQLIVTLANGQTLVSNSEVVYYFPSLPVIVYPNPVAQQTPVQILSQSPGEYTIEIFDASGRKLANKVLNDVSQQLPPFRLAKGIYFIMVTSSTGGRFVQKLLVY